MSSQAKNMEERAAHLLVVDDEENIRLTISEVLRLEGHEVSSAASGAEAARLIADGDFDLVLTDLHMADGDGLAVLEEIRKSSPLTITIVLTGFAALESAIAALRRGAYDYLTKPCNIEALKLTVGRGLEHRRLMLAEREARRELEELNRELERRVEARTAELVRLNEELSEANRAKDVFLATLSHELRTPLTPVLGWVNMLRAGGAASDPSMLDQGLDAIERNARLQARLVDDLLDISRVVSGKFRVEREAVDLRSVVAAAAGTVRPEALSRKVEVAAELPEESVVVEGSAVRLQQIVWNLLSNAVKFTPAGGRVTVSLSAVGSEAVVVVEDTGQGIEPEFLPYVFDRFRQQDGTTTRQHGGLGLGLAIVRALAELHGGRVRAESEGRGRGARFTFALPRAEREARQERPEAAAPTPVPSGVPVLLVDDSSETLELLQVVFARGGYEVVAAASAREALARARERRPAIVISDISMPEADGYALLEQLRHLPGLETVPAVALTGHASDDDRARAFAAGFAAHVAKPVAPDELLRVVRRLTD
ncbi:MAG TPA: response regulator [Pyrinomonadaceae bacterium]|nr:response regulator [Pyrinomonadaceae bacterium]